LSLRLPYADCDGLGRNALAETVAAVEHGKGRRVDEAMHRLVRHDVAALDPGDVARHADDAMAVVPGEIGADKRPRDALPFFW